MFVSYVRKIFVHDKSVLGQIQRTVNPSVEHCGQRVLGPLQERHWWRVVAREVDDVRRVVRVSVPLRHPRTGGERQQLHHRSSVLVSQGDETLVKEVLDYHQVKRRSIVQDEVFDRCLLQRVSCDERTQPNDVQVQRKSIGNDVLIQMLYTYVVRLLFIFL